MKVPTKMKVPITWLVPLATLPYPEAIQGLPAASYLINTNSDVVERG